MHNFDVPHASKTINDAPTQINVVYSNMHARITSIHMHVVVAFERYTPSRGYRRQAYIFVVPRVEIHDHLDQQQDRLPWRILHLVRVIVV